MRERLFGKRTKPIQYTSNRTRFMSLQSTMGGAELNDTRPTMLPQPYETAENLEQRFNSGANRTDMPRMWGYPNVVRHIGPIETSLSNEIRSWRRQKGEPL